jgi:hypothetical protein
MGEWLHISGDIKVFAFIHKDEGEKGFKKLLRKYFDRRMNCQPDCTSKKCRYCQEHFAVPCGWNGPMGFRVDQITLNDLREEMKFLFAYARVHIAGDLEDVSDEKTVKEWLEKCFAPYKETHDDIAILCQEAKDGKIPDKSLHNRKLYLTDVMVKLRANKAYIMYDGDDDEELKIVPI